MRKIQRRNISSILFFVLLLTFTLSACAADTQVNKQESLYSNSEHWAYLGVGENKKADLFLICPTVYKGEENRYNMPLSDEKTKKKFLGALNMEQGIYEESCRMYAPYYRQAGLNIFSMKEEEAEAYLDIAYQDVRAAFQYYMENYNEGRPIVLAGFSQGSDMAMRLMKEYFGQDKYRDLLVAAYIIGWRVTDEDLEQYPFLQMAEGEKDTGVIVSFNCEAENVDRSIIVPESTLSINPLNWKSDSTLASRELHLGACFTDYTGNIVNEISQFTGAYIDPERGTLKVTDVSADKYPPVLDIFERGVFHIYDYQFFFRNLQENVKTRVEMKYSEIRS
ncbi:DUF3089 domain-containing protein [Petroclostridium sp. X23]|uniref:DUF3089 domain-containing protein n=1 Tax=Petroclostridium sp. X23 TaxID=3045146 RepID=UPI0024AD05A2|nr:DUF3089 domain-containing protein [Petroclostridium sp. X23]WHH58639.1 DUF3089 domain-containing protein [Petroclostridium sp. X23]